MLKIDHKVPIPPLVRKQGPAKYPWTEMKVSDSFLVPNGKITSLRASASRAGATYKRKFAVRAVDGGVRIWRVK
jgi:hypothetical protein